MNKPINVDIEIVRSEALKKLGRNIINFSKIEAVLKYLLSISKFEANAEKISKQFHRNQAKYRKQTLGKLVQKFHKDILVDPSQNKTSIASSNSGFLIFLTFHYDNPDFLKDKKRALSDIVAERNKLLHQDLASLDTTCVEDYRNLIRLLDEQNPRLLAHLEEFGLIVRQFLNLYRSIPKSPEFVELVQSLKECKQSS